MRVDNAVLAVLSVAATEGNQLFLTWQLDRKLYEKTNKPLLRLRACASCRFQTDSHGIEYSCQSL